MMNISVLIIDDSRPVGIRLQRYLGGIPWIATIQYAESLQLAGVLVGEQKFDVIILDHHFPNGYGVDFLNAHGARFQDTAIVVYSAFGSGLNHTMYRELGVAAVIDKSSAPEELLATIEALTVDRRVASDRGVASSQEMGEQA
ncbi:MAG: response regulator [Bacteroidetes bacterium]|nr:response regulator [Bacteroidota bacterium]